MNREVGLNLLINAASEAVQQWSRAIQGMRMGLLLVVHTFGSDLKWHPHIHLIVTGGGLSLDGMRWIATDPRFLMYHKGLKKRWKYHVITRMKKAHRLGLFRFPKSKEFLKDHSCFASMLNKLWNVMWYAYIGASLLDPRFSISYIGRYTKRAVIAEYRIIYYDGKLVRFSFKDYSEGGRKSYKTLKVHTFIGHLIRHIPDKYFPMVRYAGLFCNRWKKGYLSQARRALRQPPREKREEEMPPSWASRQKEYTGVDPLVCPFCECPLIFVGMAFGKWDMMQSVFDSAGVDSRIPAPLLRSG
jgi:hypothetical protein